MFGYTLLFLYGRRWTVEARVNRALLNWLREVA